MRLYSNGRCARALFRKILSGCDHFYFIRCGSHLPLPLGLYLPVFALVRFRGDAPLHRNPAGGLLLSLEERGAGLESSSHAPGSDFVTETADLEQNPIIAKIRAWRPEAVAGVSSFRGELTVNIYPEHIRALGEFLRTDSDLAFTYLSDVTGVDRFPIEPRFELNYHLLSIPKRAIVRLRVRLPGSEPVIDSVLD